MSVLIFILQNDTYENFKYPNYFLNIKNTNILNEYILSIKSFTNSNKLIFILNKDNKYLFEYVKKYKNSNIIFSNYNGIKLLKFINNKGFINNNEQIYISNITKIIESESISFLKDSVLSFSNNMKNEIGLYYFNDYKTLLNCFNNYIQLTDNQKIIDENDINFNIIINNKQIIENVYLLNNRDLYLEYIMKLKNYKTINSKNIIINYVIKNYNMDLEKIQFNITKKYFTYDKKIYYFQHHNLFKLPSTQLEVPYISFEDINESINYNPLNYIYNKVISLISKHETNYFKFFIKYLNPKSFYGPFSYNHNFIIYVIKGTLILNNISFYENDFIIFDPGHIIYIPVNSPIKIACLVLYNPLNIISIKENIIDIDNTSYSYNEHIYYCIKNNN